MEHQGTLWHATPFGMVFLSRILGKALKESGRNPVAHFLAGELLDFFAGILQCFRDGDEMEHAEPLPQFSDLLREEYLWSEEYDGEADEMRYEEDEVFPADEFYSFYYDSWQSVEAYRDILEQVPAEFAKPAAAVTPMFEEFYEMYEPEEQEVVALINRCIGGGYNNRGNFWEMTVVTLGMVFCDTGKVSTKEERLDWPVTDEERNSEKGWGRFGKEQICRLKIRRMKEEWAKDLVAWPWCIAQVVKAHEDCPELQAVLDEYHRPVVLQDETLGELTLDKDYNTFEGEIQWCGTDVYLSLEVNAESKPSWTRARSAAKKLLADCETWDKAMRELAAKNLTGLANDWLSQDEENPRDPGTDPITEEELARRISMTSLSVTSGGSFTVWFDCDEMFTDHAVTVYGSLKKGLKAANIEG